MTYVNPGSEFTRDTNYISTRITADGRDGYPVEPGRYRLIVARACPWANRAIIVRRLLGLEDVLSIGFCGPTHDQRSWTFDLDPGGVDPVLKIPRLQDAYFKRDPDYPKGITVPAIVDVPTGAVVTNDFAQMTLDLSTEWTAYHRDGAPQLYPEHLRDEIDSVAKRVYTEVNNGVYRCGFAGSQEAYDAAYDRLFTALDWLSERLSGQRYLVGDTITEADVRLFTTLARFDPVYHGHFKCNRSKLAEMPVLWAYARDLFQTPGFGDTVDFVQIKQHYYIVHADINPTQIVPKGPDLANWLTPHGREALGGRPFGDGTPPGPFATVNRCRPATALGRSGPDGPHGPFGVRQGELVAVGIPCQSGQLDGEPEQLAVMRVDGRDGHGQPLVRPELADGGTAVLVGEQQHPRRPRHGLRHGQLNGVPRRDVQFARRRGDVTRLQVDVAVAVRPDARQLAIGEGADLGEVGTLVPRQPPDQDTCGRRRQHRDHCQQRENSFHIHP